MLKTLKLLIKIRLSALFQSMVRRSNKRGIPSQESSNGRVALLTVLFCFLGLMMLFFFSTIFMSIALVMAEQQTDTWPYFSIAAIGALGFALIGSVFAAQSYMFDSKDNELLLSMPIKPSAILLSRILTLHILNCVYCLLILIPAGVVYQLFIGFSLLGFIYYLCGILILPLAATAISSILGYFIGFISSKLPRKNIVATIFGFLFFGIYMYCCFNLSSLMDNMITNMPQLAQGIKTFMPPAYWFGLAVQDANILYILLVLLMCIVPACAIFWFISIKFTKIITKKAAVKGKKYVEKPMKPGNIRISLLKKELGYFLSMPGYIFNCSAGTIFSAILGIGIIFAGADILGGISSLISGSPGIIPVALCSGISLCCCMNDISAPSISLEAKTLWILKSAPVRAMDIFIGKALTVPVVSLPGILIPVASSVIFLNVSILDALFIFVIALLCCVFTGLLGVAINLLMPRFDWTNETTVIKQSGSVILATLLAIAFMLPPTGGAVLIAFFAGAYYFISYAVIAVYLAIAVFLALLFLHTKGTRIYEGL